MRVFGEVNGIKFSANCEKPPSIETMNALKAMVKLVSKHSKNGISKGKATH